MSIPLSPPAKIFFLIALFGSLLAAMRPAMALSTDQKQNIEITANASEIDDRKDVTIFTGQVVVTQGSIRITGDKMTVNYNQHKEIETLVMEGRPATYRQLPDASNIPDEAEAQHMEYRKIQNLIVLTNRARVQQASGSLSGDRIEYDTALSRVRASSAPPSQTEQQKPGERVKIVIPAQAK